MSKKYKGKTCVYCCVPKSSEAPDHVIARQFFLSHKRDNFPKVPACNVCNKTKSDLEHYLTTVLPFGATHPDAAQTLQSLVPGRLQKNPKVHQELMSGLAYGFSSHAGGPWIPKSTMPFRPDELTKLKEFIARGLAFWHWKLLLPPEACLVRATFIHSEIAPIFEQLLAQNAHERVKEALGGGVFVYEGAQAKSPRELTIWRMSFGAVLAGDQPGQNPSAAYVLTAPQSMESAAEIIRQIDR